MIGIVGAGIGGLAAGIALHRAGYAVEIFEQADAVGEVGAGLSLTPNAMKALAWLGVEPTVRALADEPPQQITRHYASGELLVRFDRSDTVARWGAPYLQIHRADLHAVLLRHFVTQCAGKVHTGRRLISLTDAGVTANGAAAAQLTFASGESLRAQAVIGADGLKSVVRRALFGDDAPRFERFVAWRGLVPRERLGALELSPGSAVFAGPGRLFVRYPVRHGALMNFVAFARVDTWAGESWSQTGDIAEPRAVLADFHPEVHAILEATPGGRCHKWGLFARDPLPSWTRGVTTLLGDAAHPMLPWFGQGAASALEDAVVLGRCLLESGANKEINAGFRNFERARLPRVTMLQSESAAGGERLVGMRPEMLSNASVVNEDSLGIFAYDPVCASLTN